MVKQSACESRIEIHWSNYVANIDGVTHKMLHAAHTVLASAASENGSKIAQMDSLTAPM